MQSLLVRPQISKVFRKIVEVCLAKQFQKPRLAVTLYVPNNAAYEKIMGLLGNNPAIVNNASIITQVRVLHVCVYVCVRKPRASLPCAVVLASLPAQCRRQPCSQRGRARAGISAPTRGP